MADKNHLRNPATTALFEAILSLQSMEECYTFFEDLCTMKELADMAQRLEAAKMLLDGKTYEQIVKSVEISTATISRINRCIQYGNGGYELIIDRVKQNAQPEGEQAADYADKVPHKNEKEHPDVFHPGVLFV